MKNIHLPKETRFIDGFFTNSWNLGDKYFQLYQTKDSTKPINDDFITTTHYTIHGGSSYGDIKGVDLAAELSNSLMQCKLYIKNTRMN